MRARFFGKDNMKNGKTATRGEITEYWTMLLRDEQTELKDRLKVSELLAKAVGVFDEPQRADKEDFLYAMSLNERLEYANELINGLREDKMGKN